MASEKASKIRRVITGLDQRGKSVVSADGSCTTIATTPMFEAVDLWRMDKIPGPAAAGDAATEQLVLEPPVGGLVVRKAVFYPDSSWKNASDYKDALSAIDGDAAHGDDEVPGMHVTHTVDVAYVISGEIVCVLEGGEAVLKAGDSIIQRGTKHAWSNRSNAPAVMIFTQVSAKL